jgi:hypothetical protein
MPRERGIGGGNGESPLERLAGRVVSDGGERGGGLEANVLLGVAERGAERIDRGRDGEDAEGVGGTPPERRLVVLKTRFESGHDVGGDGNEAVQRRGLVLRTEEERERSSQVGVSGPDIDLEERHHRLVADALLLVPQADEKAVDGVRGGETAKSDDGFFPDLQLRIAHRFRERRNGLGSLRLSEGFRGLDARPDVRALEVRDLVLKGILGESRGRRCDDSGHNRCQDGQMHASHRNEPP